MARPSVMKDVLSRVPSVQIPRSSFDRSHGYKTTFDGGYLVPVFVDEVLPGDTFNLRMTAFARMATPIHPVMDNLFLDSFFFFVPYRILWDNWERMNGAQDDPSDTIDYEVPHIDTGAGGQGTGTIYDYMGIPIDVQLDVNALPFRGYNLIWNEWFRDQNIQDSIANNRGNGPDTAANYTLQRRCKKHDYFTSALPWRVKGGITPKIPITGGDGPPTFEDDTGVRVDTLRFTISSTNASWSSSPAVLNSDANWSDPNLETEVDAVRSAFSIQRLLERDARGGTRYPEVIRSHFGVKSLDQRVQRPEYLGGGSTPVNVTPVPQTGESGSTPQGNLSGYATAGAVGHGFTKSFTEHGVVIGLVNVRADLTYQQGLERMWSRKTRYDHYWPAFAHLGEQAILSKEIYADGTANDDTAFGYQERNAEYRYKPSKITGLFRSGATGTLDPWHLSQEFSTRPTLNNTFIRDDPPIDRVSAVPSEPHFLFDAYFQLRCVRPMPMYGVPGLIDHF